MGCVCVRVNYITVIRVRVCVDVSVFQFPPCSLSVIPLKWESMFVERFLREEVGAVRV